MATRSFFLSLEKDQIVRAIVEEVNSVEEVLCAFRGELLLLSNKTGRVFKKGDPIALQVQSTRPLSFQIFDGSNKNFQRVV